MESATEYQLKTVPWEFFGTLTWSAGQLGSVRSRETQAWSFLRRWTDYCGVKLYDTPVALRWERGEIGDRPHAHFLLAGTHEAKLAACFYRMHDWNVIQGHGFARIRLYDGITTFAEYCTQDLEVGRARNDLSNANSYELGKFDYADRLCINDAAWRVMCKAAGVPYFQQHRAA
jgi:hypothetical protein